MMALFTGWAVPGKSVTRENWRQDTIRVVVRARTIEVATKKVFKLLGEGWSLSWDEISL